MPEPHASPSTRHFWEYNPSITDPARRRQLGIVRKWGLGPRPRGSGRRPRTRKKGPPGDVPADGPLAGL